MNTFEERFEDLQKEAFKKMKDILSGLPYQIHQFKEEQHVNTYSNEGYVYYIKVKSILLLNESIVLLGKGISETIRNPADLDFDNMWPEDYWTEGSDIVWDYSDVVRIADILVEETNATN